ncbi:MAG: D-alanyl-D-alanine carboxypeptidase [Acidimicrobiales bacterium]
MPSPTRWRPRACARSREPSWSTTPLRRRPNGSHLAVLVPRRAAVGPARRPGRGRWLSARGRRERVAHPGALRRSGDRRGTSARLAPAGPRRRDLGRGRAGAGRRRRRVARDAGVTSDLGAGRAPPAQERQPGRRTALEGARPGGGGPRVDRGGRSGGGRVGQRSGGGLAWNVRGRWVGPRPDERHHVHRPRGRPRRGRARRSARCRSAGRRGDGHPRCRYRDTPAAGVLRAKTGTLDHASALAGFVALPEGGHATFAFLANDAVHEIGPATSEAEALLGVVLATRQPTCPPAAPRIDAPSWPRASRFAQATGLGGAVSSPGLVVALDAMSTVSAAPVDRCSHEAGAEIDLGAP